MGVEGTLSADIGVFPTFKLWLTGPLPTSIGNLKKLTTLILVGCSFSGQIPGSIGSLQQLVFLRLDRNSLSGHVPWNLNNLSDVTELLLSNNLTGMNLTYLDMRNNSFNAPGIPLWLAGNPICRTWGEGEDCTVFQLSSNCSTPPKNCTPVSCGEPTGTENKGPNNRGKGPNNTGSNKLRSNGIIIGTTAGELQDLNKSHGGIAELKGARCFSFQELCNYTNNFSEDNGIGSGGYGKVPFCLITKQFAPVIKARWFNTVRRSHLEPWRRLEILLEYDQPWLYLTRLLSMTLSSEFRASILSNTL
ncbi:hypothetical protein Patl1_33045 [Pistacia atlantica]|uniref:Uncharacterized protein n=1 Tax=Pistacia atlantica TaxID=434234 RepID=A0ACC1AMU4_9ROSI|nr:hypothetical protein Patl1_33045 [Pistacia atlantica]